MTAIEKLTYSVGDRIVLQRNLKDNTGMTLATISESDGRKRTIAGFFHISFPGDKSAMPFHIDSEALACHSPDAVQAFEWQKGILTPEGNTVIVLYKCEGDLEFYWNIFNDEVKKYDNV